MNASDFIDFPFSIIYYFLMDRITKEQRSKLMSSVKAKNTMPEKIIRSLLFNSGFRFRLHVDSLPGKPDIVLTKYRTIFEVRGCFLHRHGCKKSTTPKTNENYWREKFKENVKRDRANEKALERLGWKIIIIWECELSDIAKLRDKILQTLKH